MSNTPMQPWANRIVGHGEEAPRNLLPNPRNWRGHPQRQQAALEQVIEEVGLVASVTVNKRSGHLVDGHLRVELALRRGEPTIPVTYVDLDEEEERVILASLDPIGALAEADRAKLGELLAGIENPDLAGLLEAVARANRLALDFGSSGLTDPDELPEPPESPVSRPGDLWLLGEHRLLCGDSTSQDDVRRLMAGERAALMATDPPYLVNYHGGGHPAAHVNPKTGLRDKDWEHHLASVDKHWDDYVDPETSVAFYVDFLKIALEHALIEHVPVYQWHGIMRTDIVMEAWREAGLRAHQILIWKKNRPVLTHAHYMWDFEPFMYGWPAGKMPRSKPPADARAVWEVAQREGMEEGASHDHPTMKPVELQRRCIEYHTAPGELIYEPFSGSGTAIIAAEMTGRRCYALELSPAFVDVAVLRWQRFTGKTASLAGDGRSFTEIAAHREHEELPSSETAPPFLNQGIQHA